MRDGFDWVTAHGKCTAEMMLAGLVEGINRDVEKRNEIAGGAGHQFTVESDISAVVVRRVKAGRGDSVRFSALDHTIHVTGYRLDCEFGNPGEFKVRVGLDHTGQCGMTRLDNGAPITKVQLRMTALRGLFFALTRPCAGAARPPLSD